VRSAPTPLPRIREQEPADDEPSDDQLDELRRHADTACRWRASASLGYSGFGATGYEEQFRKACLKGLRPCLRHGCTALGVALAVQGGALLACSSPWRLAARPFLAASVLSVCYWALGSERRSGLQWLLLHVAPLSVMWALTTSSPVLPQAVSHFALLAWLVSVVWFQLPGTAALVPTFFAALFRQGPWGLLVAGDLVSAAAVAAVALAREGLARRSFASERICSEVLGRLRSVAEDLLPPTVVADVRRQRFGGGGGPLALNRPPSIVVHNFKVISVLQTDLVGFTALARTMEAEEVLRMLNDLFGVFDRLVSAHDVFKMETVGDAYICASGLPDFARGEHRPLALLLLALDMLAAVARYCNRANVTVGLRAGIHSGAAIGGVVGTTMQRYHLFGSTMHMVEKLESTAPSGGVHLSEAVRQALIAVGEMPPRCVGGSLLELEPLEMGALQTSKGEHVPQEDVGGQATYVVWPPGDVSHHKEHAPPKAPAKPCDVAPEVQGAVAPCGSPADSKNLVFAKSLAAFLSTKAGPSSAAAAAAAAAAAVLACAPLPGEVDGPASEEEEEEARSSLVQRRSPAAPPCCGRSPLPAAAPPAPSPSSARSGEASGRKKTVRFAE